MPLLPRPNALRRSAAGDPDDAPAAERPLDPRRLRAAFQDLLGRPPLAAERARWAGRPLGALADALVGSEPWWAAWLDDELYEFLLVDNFRPRTERVTELPAELAAGRAGALEAIHRVALSPAFDRRNPGPDTFVTVVLEQLVGLTVQERPRELEIGKRLYDGRSGRFLGELGSSQADVVRIAVEDPRCARGIVARAYRRLVREEPARRELARWGEEVARERGALARLARSWVLSDAWERRLDGRRPQANRLFVRGLFVDLLDRTPEPEEERRMRDALDGLADPGPLRAVLARTLVDSDAADVPAKDALEDPTAWVAGLFERLLGRAAGEEELRTFVATLHEPACRPETILHALVSSAEYQSY